MPWQTSIVVEFLCPNVSVKWITIYSWYVFPLLFLEQTLEVTKSRLFLFIHINFPLDKSWTYWSPGSGLRKPAKPTDLYMCVRVCVCECFKSKVWFCTSTCFPSETLCPLYFEVFYNPYVQNQQNHLLSVPIISVAWDSLLIWRHGVRSNMPGSDIIIMHTGFVGVRLYGGYQSSVNMSRIRCWGLFDNL